MQQITDVKAMLFLWRRVAKHRDRWRVSNVKSLVF